MCNCKYALPKGNFNGKFARVLYRGRAPLTEDLKRRLKTFDSRIECDGQFEFIESFSIPSPDVGREVMDMYSYLKGTGKHCPSISLRIRMCLIQGDASQFDIYIYKVRAWQNLLESYKISLSVITVSLRVHQSLSSNGQR